MKENVDFRPSELWPKLADIRYSRAIVLEEYGGDEFGIVELMLGFEPLVKASSSDELEEGLVTAFGVPFFAGLGRREQKEKYLSLIAEGKSITCVRLTGPVGAATYWGC